MKPPVLQTDWMNRVAFDPESAAPLSETFFLHAVDVSHTRAFWLRLTLFSDGKERYGETQAVLFADGQTHVAKERWPLQRVQIDPERAGVGIGESNIQDKAATGVARGTNFALGWDITWEDEAPGYGALPAAWLYKRRMTSPKFCTPHPCGVFKGRLEFWQGLGRNAKLDAIDISGWRGMQGHFWGERQPERCAWVHCNNFEDARRGAFFEAFSGSMRMGGVFNPQALLGRLHLEGVVYRFDTWRHLWGAGSQFSPTGWTFNLSGPQATLRAVITADPPHTTAFPLAMPTGQACHMFGSRLASLVLELTPQRGKSRVLRSDRAAFEVIQPEPRGAIKVDSAKGVGVKSAS